MTTTQTATDNHVHTWPKFGRKVGPNLVFTCKTCKAKKTA